MYNEETNGILTSVVRGRGICAFSISDGLGSFMLLGFHVAVPSNSFAPIMNCLVSSLNLPPTYLLPSRRYFHSS